MDSSWLDAAPTPTVVVRGGNFVYANEAAARLLGRPRDAFDGLALGVVCPPETLALLLDRSAARQRGESVPGEYEIDVVRADGLPLRVALSVALLGDASVVQVRDVSGEVLRRSRLLRIAEVGAAIQARRDDEAIFRAMHDLLGEIDLAGVVVIPDGDRLLVDRIHAPAGSIEAFEAATGLKVVGLAGHWTAAARRAWREGAAFADDAGAEIAGVVGPEVGALARELALSAGLSRGAFARLENTGAPWALLCLFGDWIREEDLASLRLFGEQVSAALSAARAIASLEERNAALASINRVAQAAAGAPTLQGFLEAGAAELRDSLGAKGVAVFLLDAGRERLELAYALGLDEERRAALAGAGLPGPLHEGPGEIRVLQRDGATAGGGEAALLATLGCATLVQAPLQVRSRTVGAICMGFSSERLLSPEQLETFATMSSHFAQAVESQRLLGDLWSRVSELTLVNETARLTATLDIHRLLEDGLDKVCATLEADAGVASLVEGGELVPQAHLGLAPESVARIHHLQRGRGLSGAAVQKLAPVVASSPAQFGADHAWVVDNEGLQCAVAVPLVAKNQALGAVVVARRTPRPFGNEEVKILSAVGFQLGVAVENARLFADTARRARDMEALNRLASALQLADPNDLGAVFAVGAEQLGLAVNASAVLVLLADEAGRTLLPAAAWNVKPPFDHYRVPILPGGYAHEALNGERPLVVDDSSASPRGSMFGRSDVPGRSLLAAPLISRASPIGIIVAVDPIGRRWSEPEIALAGAFASQLAIGIENAHLFAETRRRVEELSLLYELGRSMATTLDLPRVLDEGCEGLRQLVDGSTASILLYDPALDRLAGVAAGTTMRQSLLEVLLPMSANSLATNALRERRAIAVEKTLGHPSVNQELALRHGHRSLLAAPLLLRGEPLGVVIIGETRRERVFTQAEIERVMSMSGQLAVAIDNARLYSEARKRAEELDLLHEMGRSLVASLEISQVLDAGVRNLASIVNAPDAFLLLPSPGGTHLEIRAATGRHVTKVGQMVRLGGSPSLAGWAFEKREVLAVEDATADPRLCDVFRSTGDRAFLAVPLVVRDRAIGAALIGDSRTRAFVSAEVDRATAIANQLAVAVENARLYEDLRRSYAELARTQAQLVQRERLAALGELAAVIAHEVRNPLGVIFNSLGSIRRLVRAEGDLGLLLDIVGEEADRLNRIVGDLLDFARPTPPSLRPEPLERVLDEALFSALAGRGENGGSAPGEVRIDRSVDPGLPAVPMDVRLVRQALLNVTLNAVQAMPKGGVLTVRAHREKDEVVVEIGDTGAGIPAEVRHRIFEPFFTTKATGTGLGLAVVKRIMDAHRGDIAVESAPGKGTRFTLRLPVEEDAEAEAMPPAVPGGG